VFDGGGILFAQYPGGLGSVTLSNATLSNNQCGNGRSGGGISFGVSNAHPKHLTLHNRIMWNNGSEEIHIASSDDTVSIDFSDIMGGVEGIINENSGTILWGEGNIDADPLFCEPDSGNYHIAGNSPCAGTGLDGADMGARGVGCDDIWFPPTIAAIQDTSMDEDSELSLQLSAESSQGYNIEFEAQSDTSSVYASTEGDMLHINLMTDWNGTAGITVVAYCQNDFDMRDTASFTLTVNP
jgi:hypothetical protein